MKIVWIALAALLAAGLAAQLLLAAQFAGRIEAARQRLLAAQTGTPPDQTLIPALVRAFALRNGGQIGGPRAVLMTQSDDMRLAPDQGFFPIAASQLSGTRAPDFVWEATGRMALVIPIQVVDSSVGGAGWLEARIAGSIAVAQGTGPEVDKGEAMRFLAELAWNPDAILNATGLSWRQIDVRHIEVSMQTSGGLARVRLEFDESSDIAGIVADDRPYGTGPASVPTGWIGRFSDYQQDGAYRFPRHGEIAWALEAGEFIYWRGDILSVTAVE